MQADFSMPAVRVFGYILRKIFGLLYDGVYVNEAEIAKVPPPLSTRSVSFSTGDINAKRVT
jgi:hypothetical protein